MLVSVVSVLVSVEAGCVYLFGTLPSSRFEAMPHEGNRIRVSSDHHVLLRLSQ